MSSALASGPWPSPTGRYILSYPHAATSAPTPISYWAPLVHLSPNLCTGRGQGLQAHGPLGRLGELLAGQLPREQGLALVPPGVAKVVGLSRRKWEELYLWAHFLSRGLSPLLRAKQTLRRYLLPRNPRTSRKVWAGTPAKQVRLESLNPSKSCLVF